MFGENGRETVLGRGLIDSDGTRHRRTLLRPLQGLEEADLAGSEYFDARRIHNLLSSCVLRIGGYEPVSPDLTAALSRGDRMRLALELRSMMFGDRLFLSLKCNNPDCREFADLSFSIQDFLEDVSAPEPEWIEVETAQGMARMRPPNGRDDEVCEVIGDHRDRSGVLWSRILNAVGDRHRITPEDWWTLSPDTRHRIALALEDARTAPDLSILSRCPYCGALTELFLDPFQLLARELRSGIQRLLAEIHCLAFHYGWSEEKILQLPRSRRWSYLQFITNQLGSRSLM